jgi:DNA modification methylase
VNRLYYGDNLDVLRRHVRPESVDLVYLDPPFQSGKDYNVLFASKSGRAAEAQVQAFEDTWEWNIEAEQAYRDVVEGGGTIADALRGLRSFLKESDMMAYLCMMAPRLLELRRVLKPSGSLYLHCDPTASHYLKMLLDAIFGFGCFRNEVVWRYRRWPTKSRQFQKMHDVLLFYSATPKAAHTFNVLYGYEQLAESTVKTYGTKKQKADFSSGHRKPGVEEEESAGPPLSDVWDVSVIAGSGRERLGYPTQKPLALLERVIRASSNAGDVVLDPFCGCGTAVAVAHREGRNWIGIDITHLAINLVRHRLIDSFGPNVDFRVIGEPRSLEDAAELAQNDRYQFQFWALGLVGARPEERDERRGADRGVDGRLYFHDDPGAKKTKQIILSVKSGKPKATDLRDLRAVVDREAAEIGVLITLEPPTRAMEVEAASGGFYQSPWRRHPKLQILTVDDLLKGSRIDYPPATQTNVTLRKARRHKVPPEEQVALPGIVSTARRDKKAGKVRRSS